MLFLIKNNLKYMLNILQKIKDIVMLQTVKLEQYEAKDGSILDIDKFETGGTINVINETENVPANGEYFVVKDDITYKINAKEGIIETIEEVPTDKPDESIADPVTEPVEPTVKAINEIPVTDMPTEPTEPTEPNVLDVKVKELEDKVNELAEILYELVKKINGEELKAEIKTEMKIEKLSKNETPKINNNYTVNDKIMNLMYNSKK